MAKGKTLIIVESPAKVKTLRKFLGPEYKLESSVGHIRDLPKKEFGVDVDNDFEPTYVTMPDKKDVIDKLKKAAKECDQVLLSPDPDREGEAIAWHISNILPKGTKFKRIVFYSITKSEVLKAVENPRDINQPLVNAQQARRLLDRIVGYSISPILNRRIQRGRDGSLSAGRVQSVALKLVVDREKEIEAFKPVEYWLINTKHKTDDDDKIFAASLYSVDGKKFEKEPVKGKDVFLIPDKKTADQVLARMKGADYTVTRVEKKEKKRNPVPPFITSTMQQEASRHYGFSTSRTMSIAQSLYEGIDLGNEGTEGLITYMRTDSVRVANEAVHQARDFIKSTYGKEFLPDSPRHYSSKKAAQDAHEAIRPTNMNHPPEKVQSYLTKDQFMLYQLIWKRFIASQMLPAVYDTVSADISVNQDIILRATGSTLKFQGFLAVYQEKTDDDEAEEGKILPELTEGQTLELKEVTADQSFTRPPPRFTEASLVKELEKSGIGRPSTYAAIMNKIQSREYTVKEKGRLKPTELGWIIAQMLETSFEQIMNIGFTAEMEDELELVASDQKSWRELLGEFWNSFKPTLDIAEKEAHVPKIDTDKECPKCGSHLQKIWFKSSYFYGCSKYPDCDYSAPVKEVEFNKNDYADDFNWEQQCPVCGKDMVIRHGRYSTFLGCSTYPECKGAVKIPKRGELYIPPEDMPHCPAIGCPGRLVARTSRYGKTFFSCSTFPDCDVIINDLEKLHDKYPNHERTPYQKKKASKGAKKGRKKVEKERKKTPRKVATEPLALSPKLANLVGAQELPRTEVLKRVWDYIKGHNLQNPSNKRMIVPDATLADLFGTSEQFHMSKVMKFIQPHMQSK